MRLKGSETHSERISISAHGGGVVAVTGLDVLLRVFHICAVDTNFLRHDDEPACNTLMQDI